MKVRARFALLLALPLCAFALAPAGLRAEEEKKAAAVVEKGRKVSIEYTLSIEGGEVADTNVGREPLTFQPGSGQLLPAFEAQLLGLAPGSSKEFDLSAEQGYGPVRKELYETVEATSIPEEARKVGAQLIAQAQDGKKRPVRVHEVKDDKIVLDLNHPLAGKDLHFAIKVLSIE